MEGYASMRQRATRFLKENPDVQLVTLRRPQPKQRRVYSNASAEAYGRVPETCPVLQGILNRHLPNDFKLADGDTYEDLRDRIFNEIHNQITEKFRVALKEVCEQKFLLISRVRQYHHQMKDWIEDGETEISTPIEESPRKKRRNERQGEIEVEIEEEDEY